MLDCGVKKIAETLGLLVVVGGLLFLAGCGKKNIKEENVAVADKSAGEQLAAVVSKKDKREPVKLLFLGDLMFDRYIRQAAEKKGNDFIFQGVKDLLLDYDLVVVNLEGPITDKKSVSVGSRVGGPGHMTFTFSPSLALTLAEHNIKLVNLGNNHILNFGTNGLEQTRNYLSEADVEYFGDPKDAGKRFSVKEINGAKIGFVNYNEFIDDGFQKALEDMGKAKNQSDISIVYAHWGAEYKVGDPGSRIKKLAHRLVNEGADLIIGSHPHVMQMKEEYNGKMIYYSLGNFVFDQYFSQETMEGLAVAVKINPDLNLEFQEIPLSLKKNGQTVARDL